MKESPRDEARPYLRADLTPGSNVRNRMDSDVEQNKYISMNDVARLLATIDYLYEACDGKTDVPKATDAAQLAPPTRRPRPRPSTAEEHRQEALRLVEMSFGPYGDHAGAKWMTMARRHIEAARLIKEIEGMES